MDFLTEYLKSPFGSLSKTETEHLIFSALVATGRVKLSDSTFNLAGQLRITKSKARSLVYAYELRTVGAVSAEFQGLRLTPQLVHVFKECKFTYEAPYITCPIDNQLARECLQEEFEQLNFIVEYGRNRSILKFTPEALFEIVGKYELLMTELRMNSIPAMVTRDQLEMLKSQGQKNREKILSIIENGAVSAGLGDVIKGFRGILSALKLR